MLSIASRFSVSDFSLFLFPFSLSLCFSPSPACRLKLKIQRTQEERDEYKPNALLHVSLGSSEEDAKVAFDAAGPSQPVAVY